MKLFVQQQKRQLQQASKPLKPFQGLKHSIRAGINARIAEAGFKASKTLSGIETTNQKYFVILAKGFKASKTLSGIETALYSANRFHKRLQSL